MEPRTLHLLEFPKVLAHLAKLAVSEPGREACLDIVPLDDLQAIKELQALLEEALAFRGLLSFNLPEFPSLAGLFGYLASGRKTLDLEGLYAIKDVLDVFKQAQVAIAGNASQEEPYPRLRERLYGCGWPEATFSGLKRCLGRDGQLKDESSPELFSVRLEIREIHQNCLRRVKDFVQKQGLASYLQDDFMTISSDRYVLPIKTSYKNKHPGIIHDYSQTGETCYFEPIFLVEQNNRLRELKREEAQAEAKILAYLTGLVLQEQDVLKQVYARLVDFDVLMAKTSLAGRIRGGHVGIGQSRSIRLYEARHPLLELAADPQGQGKRPANPLDITLEPGQKALIISGANASGKTVCLKTLGLAALMALSGLPVAAAENSELPFWNKIFVCMGDEQSLEDHLSTFTAQIRHLSRVLPDIDERALVIMDEFGAGTDPAQGAALAQAVVDHILDKSAYLAAATHFPALKAYGLTRPGVRAASMLFDPASKRPLYGMAYDQIGASVALDVAREYGLPEEILSQAQKYLLLDDSGNTGVFERLNALAVEREEELARLKKSRQSLEEKRLKLVGSFERDKKKLLDEMQAQSRAVLRAWEEGKSGRKQALKDLSKLRQELSESLGPGLEDLAPKAQAPEPGLDLAALKPGDKAFVSSFGRSGQVLDKDEKRSQVKLDMGGVNIWFDFADLRDPGQATGGKPEPVSAPAAVRLNLARESASGSALVLDLRGRRADEASLELGKFLDKALLKGLTQVEVVHGKGEGALRREVHNFLRDFAAVAGFSLAPADRGGDGMTIVDLK